LFSRKSAWPRPYGANLENEITGDQKKMSKSKKETKSKKKTKEKKTTKAILGDILDRQPVMLAQEKLVSAPWNPRDEIADDDVCDIAASIRSCELLERLVVIRDGEDDRYIVVAGNRRLAACKVAGLDPIPCDLVCCTVEHARRATLIENLQRKDVDPVKEAELIDLLVTKDGMTEEEIANETNRGNKWVWRRKQLRNLADPWRKAISEGKKFTVDCLEKISHYSAEIQEKAFNESYFYGEDKISWKCVNRSFNDLIRDLAHATFQRGCCVKCPNNSANAPMLFDVESENGNKACKFGTCLDRKCFARKTEEVVEKAKQKAAEAGHEVKEVSQQYQIPQSWNTKDKPDEEHCILYVYEDYSGVRRAVWGVKPVIVSEVDKAAKKAEKEIEKKKKKARECIKEWLRSDVARCVTARRIAEGRESIYEEDELTLPEYVKAISFFNLFGLQYDYSERVIEEEARNLLEETRKNSFWTTSVMNRKRLNELVDSMIGNMIDSCYDDGYVDKILEIFGDDIVGCYPQETFDMFRVANNATQDGDAERDEDAMRDADETVENSKDES